jgi:hypothetical protein
MATAADYAIAKFGTSGDEPLILQNPGDNPEFEFHVPDNALVVAPRWYEGILWYMVNFTGTIKQIKVEVSINGQSVTGYGPTSAEFSRAFHEIVNKRILKKGLNKVMFKYISGKGKFSVSDIIIFFKVDL